MGIIEVISTLMAFGIGMIPWFLPSCPVAYRFVIALGVLVCYLIFWLVRVSIQNSQLKQAHKEIAQKHRALTISFDKKRIELNRYREGINHIGYCIVITMQSSAKDRLATLHGLFCNIESSMNKPDDER